MNKTMALFSNSKENPGKIKTEVELVGVEPTSRQDDHTTTTCLDACLFKEAAAEATHRTATRSSVTSDAPKRSHHPTR